MKGITSGILKLNEETSMKNNSTAKISKLRHQGSDKEKASESVKRQQEMNRECQRRYRERALKDPNGLLLTRLQVMISANADGSLSRICEKTGMTKREAIEKALIELERSVTDG